MNEEHFAFHLQYKHRGTFANRKYEELSYPKNPNSSNSIETQLKRQPHYSQTSRENATPSSTSPLDTYIHTSFIIFPYKKMTETRHGHDMATSC